MNRYQEAKDVIEDARDHGLAGAIAASGDKEKGRKAYQDFFATWPNADQDVPLFRLALSEYASLK